MTRTQAIVGGALLGGVVAALVLVVALQLGKGSDEKATTAPATTEAPVPAEGADATPEAAVEPAPDSAGDESETGEGSRIVTRPVTIYQRANSERFALVGISRQVLWFGTAVDRARQIVQHVLGTGNPRRGAMPPAGRGISYQDVFVDDRGIAWVDLSASSLAAIRGSDEEQALVACLARSLVEALDEVVRVGILVDGEPRRSLAGHVDLERTYTGTEWPLLNEGFRPIDRPPSASASPQDQEALGGAV